MVPGNYSLCLGGCFSCSVAKFRTRSNLEEEGFILAHSFKVYSPAQQGRCDGEEWGSQSSCAYGSGSREQRGSAAVFIKP